MSTWPEHLKVGPIRDWPGGLQDPGNRRQAPFRATLTDTLQILDREIYQLVDTRAQQESAELLIAIQPGGFRLDGRPRADARPEHPGVIFSIDSRHGHLSYPCDTFTAWQDNLRAIALALEALRKVDRYGVTKRGEQYRGFLELEATAMPAGFPSPAAARAFLEKLIGDAGWTTEPGNVKTLIWQAKRLTHPDAGGDAETFQRVTLAERLLKHSGAAA
jgi:hypothetical protein